MPSVYLKNLNVAQYRGLRNLHIDEFAQFNILIGKNGVGKTSLLDALVEELANSRGEDEIKYTYVGRDGFSLTAGTVFGIPLNADADKVKAVFFEAAQLAVPDASGILQVTEAQKSYLYVKRSENPEILVENLGSAAQRIIGLGTALCLSSEGVLFVDEIENSLHWSILPNVWEFLLRSAELLNVQLFITTHSIECIRAFYKALQEAKEKCGLVIRLEQRAEKTEVEIFDVNRLAVVVNDRIEIR
jgi:AAA15 family ATPase/GTPase